MKLYEISEKYQNILDAADDDGVLMVVELTKVEDEFEDKCVAVAAYIKNLEAEAKAIREAIDGMQTRLSAIYIKQADLKDYLKYYMMKIGKDKVDKSPYFKISIRKTRPRVIIMDEKSIPEKFVHKKESICFDRDEIYKALKNGEDIKGVVLEYSEAIFIK